MDIFILCTIFLIIGIILILLKKIISLENIIVEQRISNNAVIDIESSTTPPSINEDNEK
jgi:hypothetical protein